LKNENDILTAFFPGAKNTTITASLWSVNYEGDPLSVWDDMKTRLDIVFMQRQSNNPQSEKYDFFVSDPIQVTVDPKTGFSGKKILSGDYLRAALSPDLANVYTTPSGGSDVKSYVPKEELIQGFDYV